MMGVQGEGIDAPAAVATATQGDRPYAVVASAVSNSLTVVEVRPGDSPLVAGHPIDDLGTRFDAARHVASVQVRSRTVLAVAGCDDGVSPFAFLPGAAPLALMVADGTGTSLPGITPLVLMAKRGEPQVALASGRDSRGSRRRCQPGTSPAAAPAAPIP